MAEGGGRVERIPHRYVELATGMHYWEDGQWTESKPEFTVLPSGCAVAAQGQPRTAESGVE